MPEVASAENCQSLLARLSRPLLRSVRVVFSTSPSLRCLYFMTCRIAMLLWDGAVDGSDHPVGITSNGFGFWSETAGLCWPGGHTHPQVLLFSVLSALFFLSFSIVARGPALDSPVSPFFLPVASTIFDGARKLQFLFRSRFCTHFSEPSRIQRFLET